MADESVIDCESLLDQCWAILNRKYEEVYGERNYGYANPKFNFVLSSEQIKALQRRAPDMTSSAKSFVGIDNQMLFGHPLIEQRRTPYLEAILVK